MEIRHITLKPCASYHLGNLHTHTQIRALLSQGDRPYRQDPKIEKALSQKGKTLFIAIL